MLATLLVGVATPQARRVHIAEQGATADRRTTAEQGAAAEQGRTAEQGATASPSGSTEQAHRGKAQDKARESIDLARAFARLRSLQAKDGSFAASGIAARHGKDYRVGVTALAALALLAKTAEPPAAKNKKQNSEQATDREPTARGDDKSKAPGDAAVPIAKRRKSWPADSEAARRALAWLVETKESSELYEHCVRLIALCAVPSKQGDSRRVAIARASKQLLEAQHDDGSWSYRLDKSDQSKETTLAALALIALDRARAHGVDAGRARIDRGVAFVSTRFNKASRSFHNNAWPSPSPAATRLALVALARWKHDFDGLERTRKALARESYRDHVQPAPKTRWRGYTRGRLRLELALHTTCLLEHDPERHARWQRLAGRALATQQNKDGGFDGWFGEAYGTALVVLALHRGLAAN